MKKPIYEMKKYVDSFNAEAEKDFKVANTYLEIFNIIYNTEYVWINNRISWFDGKEWRDVANDLQ